MQIKSLTHVIYLLLGLAGAFFAQLDAQEMKEEYESYEYFGVNAEPAVSLQIYPSQGGDTLTNDALRPAGDGPRVVVGFWEYHEPLEPDEIPCDGEPVMKIAYPLDYGSEQCYSWNHWVAGEYDELGLYLEPHPNSASNFSCSDDGVFNFTQWTDDACGEDGARNTKNKHAYRDRCVLDTGMLGTYPVIYSKILTGCGKEPPRRRENAECDEDTPRDPDAPYSVTLSFWKDSVIKDPSRLESLASTPPHQTTTYTWDDPNECVVWLRDVEGSDERRMNVANQFSLRKVGDEVKFAMSQNGWVCCEECEHIGTVKEYFSDRLMLDPSTGQQGDPSWGAVTDYRFPN